MSNDDVNVQFEFEDDTDDLLIWCEQPMKHIRLKRIDADCLYALLTTRFGKPPQQTLDHAAVVISWKCDRLAINLKHLRKLRGYSQSELARKVWGSIPTKAGRLVARNRDRISVYEKGKSRPRQHHLEAIATTLGVRADELAFGI